MAHYTQEQCDNMMKFTREKDDNGNWLIRARNQDKQYVEFYDTVSASNASKTTSRTNADAYLMANCEYVGVPTGSAADPEAI